MLQIVWALPDHLGRRQPERNGSVVDIYIHTSLGEFPCKGWDDEPLVLIADWMINATELSQKRIVVNQSIANHFLTGPYYYEAAITSGNLVTLRFLRSYVTGPIEKLPPVTLPFREYCDVLLSGGQSLLDTCRMRKYGTDFELEELDRHISRLRSVLLEEMPG